MSLPALTTLPLSCRSATFHIGLKPCGVAVQTDEALSVAGRGEIKKMIRNWQADVLRARPTSPWWWEASFLGLTAGAVLFSLSRTWADADLWGNLAFAAGSHCR